MGSPRCLRCCIQVQDPDFKCSGCSALYSYCQLLSASFPPHVAASSTLLLLPKHVFTYCMWDWVGVAALWLLSVSQFYHLHPHRLCCSRSLPLGHISISAPHVNLPRAPCLPGSRPNAQAHQTQHPNEGDGHGDVRSSS